MNLKDNVLDVSKEIEYNFSRSGGRGGQHVNKVETKVEARFDVLSSQLLSDAQKKMMRTHLATRLTKEGLLIITCQETRSQARNKEIARRQLIGTITAGLKPRRKRKKTKIPTYVKKKRLRDKKLKSEKKQLRKRMGHLD